MGLDRELRPVERRILRLDQAGIPREEIARRFRRSTAYVGQVLALARLPVRRAQPDHGVLRPIERRLLRWRDEGTGLDELSQRFRRGRDHLARILSYADLKIEGLGRPI